MKFVYPWMLILVALVPIAGAFWVFLRARAEKKLDGLIAPSLQKRLMPQAPHLFNLQAALLLTGLFLVVFAAARPQWGHSQQKMQARSRNVVVALDVSRSMLVGDVRPNRLERAKADIADLIDSLEGDRCALVAFRRTGQLLCPLTTDHGFLRSTLEGTTPESAPRGETDLGSAIKTSLEALDPAADDHNAIILVSDGGDLRGGALSEARNAAKRNVPIFTVGLGNPKEASTIPDASGRGVQQYQGKTVSVKLEEKALVEIAKASGGKYVALATAGTAETTLGAIYRKYLRQVAAKEQAEEEELRATERFGIFLVPGLFLMLVAAFFSRGRFAGRLGRQVATAASLVLSFGLLAEEPPAATTNAAPAAATEPASTNAVAAVAEDPAYVPPQEAQLSDREIWNKGYDFWKAGDVTNALATLQPLLLSRTHGARAAEVVGALQYATRGAEIEQVKKAAGVQAQGSALEPLRRACKAGEDSAAALQIALRATPEDPRANRNFARALTGLKDLRDELHVAEVLDAAKNKNPKDQMTEAAKEALALLKAQAGVLTNEAAQAVAESESLAARAEKLADTLIPLKQQVFQSVTNEQQRMTIVGDVEATRDLTIKAAEQLGDLSPEAAENLSKAETAFHRYWKGVLDPPGALTEGLRAQTNVVTKAERENGRDWQQEAAEFSQVFLAGFQQWAQQACAQDASSASNKPPYTAEVAQQVATAMQAIAQQQAELLKDPKGEIQTQVLTGLNRVQERCALIAGQPPQINAVDILAQTNAYLDVKRSDGFDYQQDALDSTRAFRAKFPAWAQQKAQEIQQKIQQGNTNAVPFTAEMQQEITKLAEEVQTLQEKMVKTPLPPEQLKILEKLARIRELLPKDDGGGQSQQQQQQNQQDQKKDQQKNQDQQKNDQDQQQDQQQEEQKKEQKAQQDPKDQKEVEELLRKAQERSDEHENEKKARMLKAPLSPNDRDW